MAEYRTSRKIAEDRFWENSASGCGRRGVKETAIRWRVRRAEAYLKVVPGKWLADQCVDDVTRYLEQVGRLDRILAGQFAKAVNAIQNLLVTAQVSVADHVDWRSGAMPFDSLGPGSVYFTLKWPAYYLAHSLYVWQISPNFLVSKAPIELNQHPA